MSVKIYSNINMLTGCLISVKNMIMTFNKKYFIGIKFGRHLLMALFVFQIYNETHNYLTYEVITELKFDSKVIYR